MRNFEMPGRSAVHATNGMAATSHPLATQTAVAVLRGGGNAMDAAIAAVAVQCVVEPAMTGIGGDCFVLYAPKGGADVVAYNGSGRAPAAATPEWYRRNGIRAIDRFTPHAVTVPGAIDAWTTLLRDHGTMALKDILAPAVDFARNGYPIHARVAHDWAVNAPSLRTNENAWRTMLPGDAPPAEGTIHRQEKLADTLELIGESGRDGFYRGAVAADIVAHLNELGGLHTVDDFAAATGEYVTPIHARYRGHDVYECPPNGQGIIALEILRILDGYSYENGDPLSVERLHLQTEASRLAYSDRHAYVSDPATFDADWLLSDDYIERRRQQISPDAAMPAIAPLAGIPKHEDTVYLCVVDKDRNAVSFINSLFKGFGSCIMAPRSGVMLHNRGCGFVLEPGHPNCIGPGKRPMHTIIPGMTLKDGRVRHAFGVMGGDYQATGHAHFLSNNIDFGLDAQASLDLPRIFDQPGENTQIESGIPQETFDRLAAMGHDVSRTTTPHGGGQAILIDWENGVLSGGSDPRKDGCAIGY